MNIAAKKKVADDDDGEEDEDDFQIEMEDDEEDESPKEAARAKEDDDKAKAEKSDDDEDDDEAADYSERVKKRINKLRYEFHEERRAKEEAERMRQEAIRFAEQTNAEVQKLRKQMQEGETYLYKEAEGRLDAQMAAAKRDLKEAYDVGDSDKIVEAQALLSNLAAEKSRFDGLKRRQPKNSDEQKSEAPRQQQPQRQQPAQPTPQAQKWAEKNPWFNRDPRMTAYAFGVHEDLIRNQGVQPDTEEYYRQIDKEMRKVFPSKFSEVSSDDDDDDTAPVVAAPSRKAPKKPRTIRLNKTQVALAKRLGITPEQYAAQLMKDKSNG